MAGTCRAVAGSWWPDASSAWAAAATSSCTLHPDRAICLLTSGRRELCAATLDAPTMREAVAAAWVDATSTVEELWTLTAASRDLYTPAFDALSRSIPGDIALHDVTCNGLSQDGSSVRVGQAAWSVEQPMRLALLRQRTSSRRSNGSPEWPLLTIFND